MKQLVQNILVYVVIVTMLRGLITNQKYRQYFQFFSGIIMVLLMVSPILSLLQFENDWYSLLEEKVLQMDLDNIKAEMEIADDKFGQMVKEEYEETVAKQVLTMAEEKGVETEEATVKIKEGDGEWQIEEIVVVTGNMTAEGLKGKGKAVETARMEGMRSAEGENNSKEAKALRRQICNYFVIGEDKVHIWK